ncbi:DUF2986 domain-containing protein [Shewanella colwelliana]|uniref:DUF2986 domain-containing protein n=1 Tax=Shewanella colwelliana TaxID=23 RepID=A0A1E5ITE2_SHECO|nr:DUF2986 domain-containing protein [Shewanella colwelliana]MDX1282470.1 DUF2986 domain-containing protein [Shewanella colwelliana]OEG73697.1 hypothetical protein BEL05_00245 [Shewanella colwelliana]GIU43724.1 hypothetical protein TUM3794_30040 [Shewanella colwelliana]
MNRKQKMIKKTAKRAKARHNKHTPPTVKKYVSKGDRAKELAQEQAAAAALANGKQPQDDTAQSTDTTETDVAQSDMTTDKS